MKVIKTDRMTRDEFNTVELLVVEIHLDFMELPPNIVRVDGAAYYLYERVNGDDFLCREIHSVDSGSNIIRTRTAPKSLDGIAAPLRGRGSLNTVGGDPSFIVKFVRK